MYRIWVLLHTFYSPSRSKIKQDKVLASEGRREIWIAPYDWLIHDCLGTSYITWIPGTVWESCHNIITVTSEWARQRLKSPASRLFIQPFIQTQIKEKKQSSTSLAFVRGIHRGPVNSPHKGPVTRKMFPFDDAIMILTPRIGNYENVAVIQLMTPLKYPWFSTDVKKGFQQIHIFCVQMFKFT